MKPKRFSIGSSNDPINEPVNEPVNEPINEPINEPVVFDIDTDRLEL